MEKCKECAEKDNIIAKDKIHITSLNAKVSQQKEWHSELSETNRELGIKLQLRVNENDELQAENKTLKETITAWKKTNKESVEEIIRLKGLIEEMNNNCEQCSSTPKTKKDE